MVGKDTSLTLPLGTAIITKTMKKPKTKTKQTKTQSGELHGKPVSQSDYSVSIFEQNSSNLLQYIFEL